MFKIAPLLYVLLCQVMSASNQPLTPSEKVMLSELLARATIPDEDSEVPTPSSFAVVDEEVFQGMSDAAKRRMDEPTGESEVKRSYAAKPKNEVVGYTPRGKAIVLPQGVEDLEAWGRTIIMFGKFAAKQGAHEVTYKEVFESQKEEDVRYVRWVKGQIESSNGHLYDLSLYFHARDTQNRATGQMPLIPGTGIYRRLK